MHYIFKIMKGGNMIMPVQELLLFFLSGAVLFIVLHYTMKRLLKIKQRKVYKDYNEKLYIIFRVIMLICAGMIWINYLTFQFIWFQSLISMVLLILALIISAIMAFRYAEDRNVYKIIIIHIIFFTVLYLVYRYIFHWADFF